jgi:hypothetical protein
MMMRFRTLATATLCAGLLLTGAAAQAQTCNAGIAAAFTAHSAEYTLLLTTLAPKVSTLMSQTSVIVDQPTYQTLLTTAEALAASITNGRMVVALPDGTVVLDTSKPDDPTNTLASGNSFAHYQGKTVNENHNTRIAVHDAQEWPCGIGIERKFSSTTGFTETYAAIRMGTHLDNIGTARLSLH